MNRSSRWPRSARQGVFRQTSRRIIRLGFELLLLQIFSMSVWRSSSPAWPRKSARDIQCSTGSTRWTTDITLPFCLAVVKENLAIVRLTNLHLSNTTGVTCLAQSRFGIHLRVSGTFELAELPTIKACSPRKTYKMLRRNGLMHPETAGDL